ncbi:MAG TPA: hypothetical protein VM095_14925 [Pyrinomonadaceae bacterium]|nr:hypothetical protein [Pyrinomonadaceae bacterium]
MKRLLAASIAVAGLLTASSIGCAQSKPSAPTAANGNTAQQTPRSVNGQTLTSTELPAVRLKFDKEFKYVGSQKFILYEVANAEQHFFVDADDQGRVKRLYWVQFEGYLPSNTEAYDYKVNKAVKIGGLEFIADAYARNLKTDMGRPDSDGSRARSFLESKGYRMASDDILSQRLVHLVDKQKRNELMIIYTEALGERGLTAADFGENGRAAARRDEIMKGLLERALKSMKVAR